MIKNTIYQGIIFKVESQVITPEEHKDYGFITKYRIQYGGTAHAVLIQKYTGETIYKYERVMRVREWIYDLQIDSVRVSGSTKSMTAFFELFKELLEGRNVQT